VVQENALVAAANATFFHENNRKRVGQMQGALQKLISLSSSEVSSRRRRRRKERQAVEVVAVETTACVRVRVRVYACE
jgi:hypothetical protein